MSDSSAPEFDQVAFREEVRKRLEGKTREQISWFAARCAWRALPWLVHQLQEANSWRTWWLDHGAGYQAAVAIAMLQGSGVKHFESLNYVVATNALGAASHAAHSVAASSMADAVDAAAEAALYSLPPVSDRRYQSNVARMLCFDSTLLDLDLLSEVPIPASLPLFRETPTDLIRETGEALLSTSGKVFYSWFANALEGRVPVESMKEWLEDWWRKHSQNTESTSAFLESDEDSEEEESSASSVAPRKGPKRKHEPKKKLPPGSATVSSDEPVIQFTHKPVTKFDGDLAARVLTPTADKCKEALRTFLLNPETEGPLTVSIEAPWGGGKTSLMNVLRTKLTEDKVPTIWFNPWKHEAGKTLWAAFALAFQDQMESGCAWRQRFKRRVQLGYQRLKSGERWLMGLKLLGWLSVLLGFGVLLHKLWHGDAEMLAFLHKLTSGAAVTDKAALPGLVAGLPSLGLIYATYKLVSELRELGTPLKLELGEVLRSGEHAERVDDLHRFHADFRRLLRAYVPAGADGKKPKVVVFIDDLDRCEATKVAEMLQSLHLMLSVEDDVPEEAMKQGPLPGVICLLGMDREKVAAAVAAKHQALLPFLYPLQAAVPSQKFGMEFGEKYLEKFIQVTLRVPPLRGEDADHYLRGLTGYSVEDEREMNEGPPKPADDPKAPKDATARGGGEPQLPKNPETSEAKAAAIEQVTKKQLQIINRLLKDSSVQYEFARELAPSFGNNPRRLKLYVNALRLRIYVAAALNLFNTDSLKRKEAPAVSDKTFTAQQLAKILGLEMAFPDVWQQLMKNPTMTVTEPAPKSLIDLKSTEPVYTLHPTMLSDYFRKLGG